MSVQAVLSLRDTKAELFLQPFFVPTIAVALRDIGKEAAAVREGNQLNLFPKDFEVWQLASFDPETGTLVTEENGKSYPAKVCDVSALVVSE